MSKLRFYAAMLMAKTMYLGLKLLGRNASYLPGKVAVKLCKDFLAHLQMPKTVVCVTGTNGKTTVSNMLTKILRECGYSVTNNALGSNVQAGVATALIEDADFLGRTKKEIAVLEVDERSSLLVYPYIKPDFILCNNIMRDSVKRNAHTDFITYISKQNQTVKCQFLFYSFLTVVQSYTTHRLVFKISYRQTAGCIHSFSVNCFYAH